MWLQGALHPATKVPAHGACCTSRASTPCYAAMQARGSGKHLRAPRPCPARQCRPRPHGRSQSWTLLRSAPLRCGLPQTQGRWRGGRPTCPPACRMAPRGNLLFKIPFVAPGWQHALPSRKRAGVCSKHRPTPRPSLPPHISCERCGCCIGVRAAEGGKRCHNALRRSIQQIQAMSHPDSGIMPVRALLSQCAPH